jgi:hypothetical protein
VRSLEDLALRTHYEGEFISSMRLNLTQMSDEINDVAPMQTSW